MTLEDADVFRRPWPMPEIPDSAFAQLCMRRLLSQTGAVNGNESAMAEAVAAAGPNVACWPNSKNAATSKAEQPEAQYKIKKRAHQVKISHSRAVERLMEAVVSDWQA